MQQSRQILEKLVTERGESYSQISILLGRNRSYLQQFIKRGTPRRLSESDRKILASHFGIAEELLAGGLRQAIGSQGPAFRTVRCLLLGAKGEAPRPGVKMGAVNVDPAWLHHMGVGAEHISFCRIVDDAMAPTLVKGDEIMIDHSDIHIRKSAELFALRLDQIVMIRRASLSATHRLSILADKLPPIHDIDPKRAEIIGRVIWQARNLL